MCDRLSDSLYFSGEEPAGTWGAGNPGCRLCLALALRLYDNVRDSTSGLGNSCSLLRPLVLPMSTVALFLFCWSLMQLLRSCSEVQKWLFTLQILQVVSPFMSCNAFKPCHMDSKKILVRMEISSCSITASLDLGIPPAKLTRLSFTLSWHILIILHAALGTEFTSSWLLAVQLLGCRELGKVRIDDR